MDCKRFFLIRVAMRRSLVVDECSLSGLAQGRGESLHGGDALGTQRKAHSTQVHCSAGSSRLYPQTDRGERLAQRHVGETAHYAEDAGIKVRRTIAGWRSKFPAGIGDRDRWSKLSAGWGELYIRSQSQGG